MPAVHKISRFCKTINLLNSPDSKGGTHYVTRFQTYVKILYFDRSGYCLWAKRLERGRFHYRSTANGKVELDATQLKLLLEGIDVKQVRRYKRYHHSSQRAVAV